MPYREKIAWLSLIAIAVTFGPYFAIVAARPSSTISLPGLDQLRLYAVAAVAQMLILGVGRICIRRRSPLDAATPPDERDRTIEWRSIRSAYYVLIGGMILVGCVMPFRSDGWSIIHAAIAMIIAAEIVHYSIVVVSYRRQL
jgi:cytochrome b561